MTHSKLPRNSVTSLDVKQGTLTSADLTAGTLAKGAVGGPKGDTGAQSATDATGATGPQGLPGGAAVGVRARFTRSVSAPKGANTSVPLTGNTWTHDANELDLITGSMTVNIPASCTGSFGNALVVSVDGTAARFALASTTPASGTVTMPFNVGILSEPTQATPHTVTASFGNSCTKDGENFTVSNVKLDVIQVP